MGAPPVAAVVLDQGGTIVSWSQAAEDMLGYSAREVLGRPGAFLLFQEQDGAAVRDAVARSPTAADREGVLGVRHRNGRRLDVAARVCPTTGPDGEPQWLLLAVAAARTPWWTTERSLLEHLPAQTPVGMAVVDTDLRCIWLNDALVRTGGLPREQRLGRRLSEVLPGLPAADIEAQMRQVLETGLSVIDLEYWGHTAAAPVRDRAYSMSFFRLGDSAGRVLGVGYLVIDVTDRRQARQRLALLNDASARISNSLDVMRTAQELAEVAVPQLADFVVVDLLVSVVAGDEPAPGPVAEQVPLIRGGQQSVREGCPEAVYAIGEAVSYPSSAPVMRALYGGGSALEAVFGAGQWAAADPKRAARMREFGMHSAMVVPVAARGVTMGAASFWRWQEPEPFERDDLMLAEEFVARAAVCIDNARRYTREHLAALALQRSLLPHGLPEPAAAEVAHRYLPADERGGVGGDWFDVIPLSGSRVALAVGDVVGHGLHAAAAMGRLRAAVHTLANLDMPPDEVLAHLDDLAIRLCEEESANGEAAESAVLGATCLYAVYDPVSRKCGLARAGHPAPAVVAPDGTVDFPELPAGPPLGLGGLPFEAVDLELAEGSLLALYTNGLLQAKDDDSGLALDRLSRVLARRSSGRPVEDICTAVIDSMLAGRRPDDDVALLIARTRALGAEQVASWEFPADPAIVSDARARTSRQLAEWGLDDAGFTSELVVSELVTNAIRYASGPIRLRLIRDHALICEVSDGSSTSPRLRHARTTDEGGRGLFLIAQLTQRWGTRHTSEGKTIWAEQYLTGARMPSRMGPRQG
ncbi:SpoIIE family protein phosphatase [Streptomyces sp. NPDC004647]|uniref:SpoIIE family protein phosphatase n=1 Tax=Streptomyces sp. NPDC004647 TaxID=3154671 RepID=UPI0033A19C3E